VSDHMLARASSGAAIFTAVSAPALLGSVASGYTNCAMGGFCWDPGAIGLKWRPLANIHQACQNWHLKKHSMFYNQGFTYLR